MARVSLIVGVWLASVTLAAAQQRDVTIIEDHPGKPAKIRTEKRIAALDLPSAQFGDQRVLVIPIAFSDYPAQPWTAADITRAVFGTPTTGSPTGFYTSWSNGQTTFALGAVTPWMTIPSRLANGCRYTEWRANAEGMAGAAGFTVSAYTRKVYITNVRPGCAPAGMSTLGPFSPSETWAFGSIDFQVLAHELGHGIYGLPHTAGESCGVDGPSVICRTSEYGGLDIMGNQSISLPNAIQRENAGIAAPLTVTSSGDYFLEPYGGPENGMSKAMQVMVDAQTRLTVEYRTNIGYDWRVSPGVNLHTGRIGRATPLLRDLDRVNHWTVYTLWPGGSYTLNGITVRTVTADASGAVVHVDIPGTDPLPPPPPTLTAISRIVTDLRWSNLPGSLVDIFRDAVKILTTPNDGSESVDGEGEYQVCGSNVCVP